MSGIVGIFNLDGAPVDRELLHRMTASMAFRGPDAQEIWSDGPIGFGHTMLRTTFEAEHEHQPMTLDGQVWITADCRVDGRSDLIRELAGHDRRVDSNAPDPELILHAYHVWGEDCVKHLIGDFAFAIWDGRSRNLFCARDHFGVKPFYYAQGAGHLLFSNTLNCLRQHPSVSARLNDDAIGSFLLHGINRNPATTCFNDIHTLEAARCLVSRTGAASIKISRFWSLPIDGRIRFREARDYVSQFREVFATAVIDRLRTNRVSISMSGGLDSTSIAAMAKRSERPVDLQAHTVVYDHLFPDEERHYSGIAAQALDLPIHYLVADKYKLCEGCDRLELGTPEPGNGAFRAMSADYLGQVASHARVLLTGDGGDSAMRGPGSLGGRPFPRLLVDIARCSWLNGRVPSVGLRPFLARCLHGVESPRFITSPDWMNPQLAARVCSPSRRRKRATKDSLQHPERPEAYRECDQPFGSKCFESSDPGFTSLPVELRYPFSDVRLISFMLAIPAVPWFLGKAILRVAMRGHLPDAIRLRKKQPLGALYPSLVSREECRSACFDAPSSVAELDPYVDRRKFAAFNHVKPEFNDPEVAMNLRPISLACWLRTACRNMVSSPIVTV